MTAAMKVLCVQVRNSSFLFPLSLFNILWNLIPGKLCSSIRCPSDKCIQLPTGPKCTCGQGYTNDHATFACDDIDECRTGTALCSQKCRNLPGSFRCECVSDFHLDPVNNRSCLPNSPVSSWIFFSTNKGIFKYNLEHGYEIRINDQLNSVVAVAADESYVYWTENEPQNQRLARMKINGTSIESIAKNGVGSAEGLAVDWYTGNVYYTDSIYCHIAVCGHFGTSCLALITQGLHKPRGIVLHPSTARMFWTDWGDRPHIGVAYMDGKEQRDFLVDGIAWPNGLSIDYPAERLYFVDAKTGQMASVSLNGDDRKMLRFDDKWHVFNLQVLDSKIYWTEKIESTLNAMDKFTGKHPKKMVVKSAMRSLYTYHPLIHRKANESQNPCHQNACEEVCLLSARGGHTCACGNGRLLDNTERCQHRPTRILIGYHQDLYELQYEDVGVPKIIPVTRYRFLKIAISRMVYNALTGEAIVADNNEREIWMLREGGLRKASLLVHRDIGKVSSMAMDQLANNLYWTDSERQSVEMISLNTHQRTIVHMFHKDFFPYALVVSPKSGKLFVAVNKDPVKVFQMALNGAGVTNYLRKWRMRRRDRADVALTIDENNSVIYVALGRRIIAWNYVQNKELDYRSNLSLTANQLIIVPDGRRFFWTGSGDGHIYWDTKSAQVDKSILLDLARDKYDTVPSTIPIVALPQTRFHSTHPCMSTGHGGCSDICVNLGSTHTCLCGIGRTFKSKENRTCIPQIDCEFRCGDGSCITLSRFCNGKKDCADGSDEELCHAGSISANHIQCNYDEFKCFDGSACLANENKCDHHVDCKDGSDEWHCENFDLSTRCHKHQFLCNITRICVDLTGMCDNYDDCGDRSDERGCDLPKSMRRSCGELYDCGSGQCVDKAWVCDGEPDCQNGDDEATCSYSANSVAKSCSEGFFECRNGMCIELSLVCDGHRDCVSGLDEERCEGKNNLLFANCSEYACPSNRSICLKEEQVCDGITNCPRGEDEMPCLAICPVDEIQCQPHYAWSSNLKRCLNKIFLCDGEKDCPSGSDEENCTSTNYTIISHITCHSDMFHCNSGECVEMERVCNSISDCVDGSDEGGQCDWACDKNKCSDKCVSLPTGPKCVCEEGYELTANGKSCRDINECLDNPCAQMCENNHGSYVCTCYPNFMLTGDKHHCKAMGPKSVYLYSTGTQIRRVTSYPVTKDVLFKTPLDSEIFGMAVDGQRQLVYASSTMTDTIYRIDLQNKTAVRTVQADFPEKMAVDWSSGNLYLADNSGRTGGRIRVCDFETARCVAIVSLNPFVVVEHLEVDARAQLLFFVQVAEYHGFESQKALYSCRLDGTKKRPILKPFPDHTSFTLDVNKRVIYYADPSVGTLTELNYEGQQERRISSELRDLMAPAVHGMRVFENVVYLTVSGSPNQIHCSTMGDRLGPSCHTSIMDVANARHFFVVQQTVQPEVENFCANHRCTRMCVPTGHRGKCMCNGGLQVGPDEECPMVDGEEEMDLIHMEGEEVRKSSLSGTDLAPSVAGRIVLILFLILTVFAGATYYVYRRRYLMSTFSIS